MQQDPLAQAVTDLLDALNRTLQCWIAEQGVDDLQALSGLMAQGARAGVRFVAPKPGGKPELAFLLVDRAGEHVVVAELDAMRSLQ